MVIQVPLEAEREMRDGLRATSLAVGHYAAACRVLRQRPDFGALAAPLDGSIARLEAIQRDLAERSRHATGPDALFIALNVAEAGLSSLTGAVGEMRQACWALFPHPEPEPGWFIDPTDDA